MLENKVIIKIKQAGISGPYDILLASHVIDLNSLPAICFDTVNNGNFYGIDIKLNHRNPSFTLKLSIERYYSTNPIQYYALGINE